MFYGKILPRDRGVSQNVTFDLKISFTSWLDCLSPSDLVYISIDEQKIEFILLKVVVLVSEHLLHGSIELQ